MCQQLHYILFKSFFQPDINLALVHLYRFIQRSSAVLVFLNVRMLAGCGKVEYKSVFRNAVYIPKDVRN